MSEVTATCITRLPLSFPAYLAAMINGGYKTEILVKRLGNFDLLVEARCPFAGGWADMSARESRTDKYVYAKANLRIKGNKIKVRVDNRPPPFHLDIEMNGKIIISHVPVELDSKEPSLLSAFEIAKQELLKQVFASLPHLSSIEQPNLELLQMIWEAKWFANSIKLTTLLPTYPGSRLTLHTYSESNLPIRVQIRDIELTVEPFRWQGDELK